MNSGQQPGGRASNTTRWRIRMFAVAAVAVVAASVVVTRRGTTLDTSRTRAEATEDGFRDLPLPVVSDDPAVLARIAGGPHALLVRYPQNSSESYEVHAVALPDVRSGRARTGLSCSRIAQQHDRGICLVPAVGRASGTAFEFDAQFRVVRQLAATGFPSRVRVRSDAKFGAMTFFISGHSYLDSKFSTQTQIIDLSSGAAVDLETYRVMKDGKPFKRKNFNFWGVSFEPAGTFVATLGSGAQRYLVRGNVTTRTMSVAGTDMGCPAVSPDGRRLVFKRAVVDADGSTHVPFFLLDLGTGKQTRLLEPLDSDDQAEWLDDHRVIYGRPTGPPAVAAIDVDGDRRPVPFANDALSPSVVRRP